MELQNDNRIPKSRPLPANPVALQFCWHLRVGMFRGIASERICTYAGFFYNVYLEPHFEHQVELIRANPELDKDVVKKMLCYHRKLRRLFESNTDPERCIGLIEDKLEEMVRFEKRVFYKELLNSLKPAQKYEDQGFRFYDHRLGLRMNEWKDCFWRLE